MKRNIELKPGEIWRDTEGQPIQAHGGGILYKDGTYYWYGENKDTETVNKKTKFIGFNAYSSTDLLNWKNHGVILAPVTDNPDHDLHTNTLPERPKVLFNKQTNQYVMWIHIDRLGPDNRRSLAHTGVAVSDSPLGPFRYLGSFRPNECDSRDMTVFQEEDGSAWLIYASQKNADLHITRLTDDYLSTEKNYVKCFQGTYREAPAVYKHEDNYILFTSGCSGWFPNAAEYAIAKSMTGPWKVMGNPCLGNQDEIARTFDSQITFILPPAHKTGSAIMMADRWNPDNLRDSRYIWLPIEYEESKVTIKWHEKFSMELIK